MDEKTTLDENGCVYPALSGPSKKEEKKQGRRKQLICTLAATVGAISDGMHYGWSAPLIPILKGENSPLKINDKDETWLESVYLIGGLMGLPVTIFCVDKLGRKKSILLAAIISLVSWLLIGFANHKANLYIARFLVGLSGDMAFVAAPMYIAEIADHKIRGFLSGFIYLMMLVGILVIYAVAPFVQFYLSSVIGAVFVVIQLIWFPFEPDSPYYLLSKGKLEKAGLHLQRLRKTKNVEKELEEISAAVRRQRSERGRPQDLFISKGNRKAVIIMVVLNAAQHFSSISVMLMNIHTILSAADSLYVLPATAGIMFSAIMLIAGTITDVIVDKFGRKSLLATSSILSGICLLVLAVFFSLKSHSYDVGTISWIPIAAVMVYAGVFKLGLGMIPIVMTAELFPAKVKAMGMTFADFSYLVFALISVEIYQYLMKSFGMEAPFYVFAASTLATAVFCIFYIPETKGKTLEEIQFILKGETMPLKRPSAKEEGIIIMNGKDKLKEIEMEQLKENQSV